MVCNNLYCNRKKKMQFEIGFECMGKHLMHVTMVGRLCIQENLSHMECW